MSWQAGSGALRFPSWCGRGKQGCHRFRPFAVDSHSDRCQLWLRQGTVTDCCSLTYRGTTPRGFTELACEWARESLPRSPVPWRRRRPPSCRVTSRTGSLHLYRMSLAIRPSSRQSIREFLATLKFPEQPKTGFKPHVVKGPVSFHLSGYFLLTFSEMAGFRLESWRSVLNQKGAPRLRSSTLARVPVTWRPTPYAPNQ